MKWFPLFLVVMSLLGRIDTLAGCYAGKTLNLLERPISLRSGEGVEWDEFGVDEVQSHWQHKFDYRESSQDVTLLIQQYDVKQRWEVVLNGEVLGNLTQDENLLTHPIVVPANILRAENILTIRSAAGSQTSDDIRVDRVMLVAQPMNIYLTEGEVLCEVTEIGFGETPYRLTILDEFGALVPLGMESGDGIAVRIGTIYSRGGPTIIRLPQGKYRIIAGRGFEYSLGISDINVQKGIRANLKLGIERQVNTQGYVACDPHVHTLSYSGHGDSTIEERVISLAGEGIELPVATEHNRYMGFDEQAKASGVRKYFTPIVGCEVTTSRGHFNIFPVNEAAVVVDHREENWNKLFEQIWKTPSVKVAILNHARDLHSNYRPFGEEEYASQIGVNVVGREFLFNAMETINSGATQSDPLQLFNDWMSLLNAGHEVCPIGSSDSHDVSRYIVGQGRTYVRCEDSDPAKVNVLEACDAIRNGRVGVSYGLWVDILVDGQRRSGDVVEVPSRKEFTAEIIIQAPHWSSANRLLVFRNGKLVVEKVLSKSKNADLPFRHQETITLPAAKYDSHLVAIATGSGVCENFWRLAKPYQPRSSRWEPMVMGCSGAVWIDGDGDGRKTSAQGYARALMADEKLILRDIVQEINQYDEAIATQAFWLLQHAGKRVDTAEIADLVLDASDEVRSGYRKFREAWRQAEIARAVRK